jgi:cell division protein FtsL
MRGSSSDRTLFWLPLAGLLVAVSLVMVWQRVKAHSFQRESNHLRQDIDAMRLANGRLEAQIHQWTAPSHLAEVAKKDYGMAPAKPGQQSVQK